MSAEADYANAVTNVGHCLIKAEKARGVERDQYIRVAEVWARLAEAAATKGAQR